MGLIFATPAGASDGSPRLDILRWQSGSLEKVGQAPLEGEGSTTVDGVEIAIRPGEQSGFQRWEVAVHNRGNRVERLVLRLSVPLAEAVPAYWDGLATHHSPERSIHTGSKRYRFPASAAFQNGTAIVAGFAPENLSSRFESGLDREKQSLYWDAYLALHPGQKDRQIFVTAHLADCRDYSEMIEAYYLAWPEWFHPVKGADHRLYGEGGYFWSSDATRDLQKEEARRLHLDWEWYYAPFQRAGAVFATDDLWKQDIGFNLEETPWEYDQTGGPAAWERYNDARINHANETSATFYYYLQQYADADLLQERFRDSYWLNAEGKPYPKTFGWIKLGLWVQFAWPGETSYGERLRVDLARAWERFAIAGFALDCVIGDIAYYGEALSKEHSKAFDDQGRIFAVEGIPIARNLTFTRNLPAKPDGRRAASIANEAVTYHGAFHSDALMHEKPAYERADLLSLRRLLIGQKPMYIWKGYRADSLLNWEELSPEDFREGLQGIVDYSLLACLRFGAMPSMFFVNGYPQMHAWLPTLVALQRAGWRAAPYARVPENVQPATVDPYSEKASLWIARYGTGAESWLTISSPRRESRSFPLTIETDRFGNGGALYLNTVTGTASNRVAAKETEVDLTLRDHQPAVLEKIAEVQATAPVRVIATRRSPGSGDGELLLEFPEGFPTDAKVRLKGEQEWRPCEAELRIVLPAVVRLDPPVAETPWIDQLDLGSDEQSHLAILVLPEDRAALEPELTQLAHYLEYYHLRQKNPIGRLHTLGKVRQPKLVATLCESLDALNALEPATAKTVLAMGEQARRLLPSQAAKATAPDTLAYRQIDGRAWIAANPGSRSEKELWSYFLQQLDRRYPFHGGLEAGPMFQKHEMVGKTLPAAHTPNPENPTPSNPAPVRHENQE